MRVTLYRLSQPTPGAGASWEVGIFTVFVRAVGKVQYIDPNRCNIARYSVSRSMGCI